ncbi:MAG: ribonuclease E/G, partial [Pseudomonadota bacterium]|nr:ribonuclease E/G [Pseudomonadota bacterium]
RRLAKLAAEQAKEAHIASNATPTTVESTETKEEAPAPVVVETEVVAEPAAPEQQPLELATTDAEKVPETEVATTKEETAKEAVVVEETVVVEAAPKKVKAEEKSEAVTEKVDAEDEAAQIEKEKSSRPRRPRGRPPKKSTASNE